MKTKSKKSSSRKVSKTPTKIYVYGAKMQSSKDESIVLDEAFKAHLYMQNLVRMERSRRAEFRALRRTLDPKLELLEAEIDKLSESIREGVRQLKSKNDRRTEEAQIQLVRKLEVLRDQRKSLFDERKELVAEVTKKYFEAYDETYSEAKKAILAEKAKDLGIKSVGPNNGWHQKLVAQVRDTVMDDPSYPEEWKKKLQIDVKYEEVMRQLRDERQCYSGTGGGVEEAFNQAKKNAKVDPEVKKYTSPKGRVKSIQPTKDKGMRVPSVMRGGEEILRITPTGKVGKDGHEILDVRMKIAGKVKNAVFVNFTISYHRPLPSDGVIKHAYIMVRTVGYHTRYELQIVMEAEYDTHAKGVGHVALNFGWRTLPSKKVRIAASFDGAQSNEFTLSYHSKGMEYPVMDGHGHIEALLSSADFHFNAACAHMSTWVKSPTFPEELKPIIVRSLVPSHIPVEGVSYDKTVSVINKLESHGKLRKVVRALLKQMVEPQVVATIWKDWVKKRRTQRQDLYFLVEHASASVKDTDDLKVFKHTAKNRTLYEYEEFFKYLDENGIKDKNLQILLSLEWWVRKDEHLTNWARNLEVRFSRYRKHVYRMWAVELRRKYATITIAKWDKSKTAKSPNPEEDDRTPQQEFANRVRQRVGISVFTEALKEVFGEDLVEVSLETTTHTHYHCGGAPVSKLTLSTSHMCTKCSRLYDQDVNTAIHLWHRNNGETPSADQTARPSRKPKNKAQKAQISV